VRLYVNGALTSTGTSSGSLLWHTDEPFMVGNDPAGAYPFRGTLHLVSAYTRALTAAEVTTNYQAG
jgi:hypothetical protein